MFASTLFAQPMFASLPVYKAGGVVVIAGNVKINTLNPSKPQKKSIMGQAKIVKR